MSENLEKILQGCFHPKTGRTNLQRIPEDVKSAKQHIEKAHGNLRAMKLMNDNELFDWSVI